MQSKEKTMMYQTMQYLRIKIQNPNLENKADDEGNM